MPKFLTRLAVVCSLLTPLPVMGQECAYCAGKTPDQLIRDSVGLGSPALRAQIRAWLAKNHPNTGPGLTARAWIARSNNAPSADIVALYQQALDTDPSQGLAWTNLGYEFDSSDRDEEAVKAYIAGAKVWREQPFFLEYAAQVISAQLNDPQRTEDMLRQAAQENWVARWIPDYVRGVRARTSGDRRAANQYFERALDQGGTNKDLINGWLDNQLAMEAAQRTPMSSRMRVIDRAVDIARRAGNDAVLRHAGKLLWDDFDEIGEAYRLFVEAYQMRPTPEAAADAFGAAANDNFDLAWQSLERGLRDFPNNYLLLETAVWAWTDFRHEPDRADDFGRRAIAAAPTQRELETSIDQYADFARDAALFDRAVSVFESGLNGSTGRSYNNILGDYIDNRIYARDFNQAARLLKQARERNFSDFWLAIRDNRITSALRLENAREQFFSENPFLRDWENRFGESLRVTVEFATGKADLRGSAASVLDQAASALKAPGAENYVFLVEGHTDSTGTDAVNLPLSRARAEAVEGYFVQNAGITPERLQTVGYGPRIPLATNATDAGKQTNRRVEIRPYGNVTSPRISAQGWLNGSQLALTPDGRFAVTGHTPAQVWDLERMTRVHQLPVGGNLRAISPNGRYVALGSRYINVNGAADVALYIYDLRTGLLHTQIPNAIEITELSWSPFSEALAYTDRTGFLRVFNLSERSLRVTKMDDIRGSEDMTWVNNGRYIVTKSPRTPTAQVYDAKTLQRVRSLNDVGWVHGMTSTYDGKHVVMVTNNRLMIVFDTDTWREVRRQRIPGGANGPLVPHPNQQQVMIVDAFNSESRLALVDVSTGELISALRGPDRSVRLNGGFTPDGARWITAIEGAIQTYDTATMRLADTRESAGLQGYGITIVDRLNLIVAADEDGTSVYSLETGRQVHRVPGRVGFRWYPLNEDSTVLFSLNIQGELLRLDLTTFQTEVVRRLPGKPWSLSVRDDQFAVGLVPQGEGPFTQPRATIMLFNKASLFAVAEETVAVVTAPTQFSEIYNPKVFVRLSDDGKIAVTSAWGDGYLRGQTNGRLVTVLDPQRYADPVSFQTRVRYGAMEWENDQGDVLKFRNNGRWYRLDPGSGRQLGRATPDDSFVEEMEDGRRVDWNYDYVAFEGREIAFPNNVRSLEVHEDRNLIVAQTTGSELVFINLTDMTQALTIAPRADGEWIAFTPDGRYTASLNGTRGVYWSLGDNYLPFDALARQNERPNLIRELLASIARGEASPQDTTTDVETDVFEAPYTVRLVSPERLSTEDETFVLELEVEKANADLPDPEIEYTLNGRRVLKSRGFDEEAFFDGAETLGLTRRFNLNHGANVIEAALVWREARIQLQRVEVTREGAPQIEQTASGQTLWFFGVGVSDYERSSQNLNFAHRDAQELARLMEAQQGSLFDRVETKILTNDEATERNVRIQMNEFLSNSSPDDVVVMFLAGHGVTDAEQDLYFMTHEGDLSKPYTGMSVDRFRDFLENRPLNQNALLLLDICHSGAAEGRVVAEDAVQSLASGTGAVVFASSSGSELSFEDESFGGGHGAFTAALLEGLRGMADSRVGDRDGFNTLQEMILFTSSRVPELTEGQQRPQIPRLALEVDYPLSRATN